ncbi:argininosuccinate lyase [Hallerella succinigenes]|uniref:Argininosuccinate lyase n=1 Tax=Hallerella succinigenes TaxID=1896222 RepID=A0A2M9A8I6_9BACT|nr:argininosuccinate lyase [Hallerella succinigenes]PJJ42035.1 argininosuccinate lyase [Hallerella succinigenes]
MAEKKGKKMMWDGRFDCGMAQSMIDLSFSLDFDKELLEEDIQGSLGHGKGLVESGVLTKTDYAKIRKGLLGILDDVHAGKNLWLPTDEDVHMAVERVLTDRIGDLGKKIHTGRSRNDQVSTDFKLYMRHRAVEIRALVVELQKNVLDVAKKNFGKIMPGYTHLQQAQPILFSHYMMSLFFALSRDVKRLDNFLDLHVELPLGSGAIAGSAFPYHRQLVAEELGFERPSANSIDAVSHRDMALEFLNDLAIIANTLSRYAEDFVIWSSSEFGYLTLSDAFSSGSSMMPQKKNPDSMELIRGKSGRMLGNYTAMFTLVKGAPLSYSRDLQEDKQPVFDSTHTAKVLLRVMSEAIASARWNFDRMEDRMLPALLATDLADILVEDGVPFRDAHRIVGSLVGEAAKLGEQFTDLSDEAWAAKGVPNPKDVKKRLTFAYSVSRRNIEGGTGANSVKNQFKKAEAILKKELKK